MTQHRPSGTRRAVVTVRVRGSTVGLALWRLCGAVPLVGTRLRWAVLWPLHRWVYAAWIDGRRV